MNTQIPGTHVTSICMLSSFSLSLSWTLFRSSLYLAICSALFFSLLLFFSSGRGWTGFSAERTFKSTFLMNENVPVHNDDESDTTNLLSVALPPPLPPLPHWRSPGKPWSPCPTDRPYWTSCREPWPGRDPFHPTSARPVDMQQTQDVHYCRWVHRLRPEAGFSVTDLGCGGGRGCEEFGLVGTVIHISGSVCGLVVKRHVIRDEPATMRHLWILALRNLFRVLDGFS